MISRMPPLCYLVIRNLGALVKERLEAAVALKKTLGTDKQHKWDFYKGHC